MKILALDIGGTFVKYGRFGESDSFGEFSVKDSEGTERLPEKLLEFIQENYTENIGIAVPGPFDFDSGTSLMQHKLKSLYKINLKELLKQHFPSAEIFFIHDSTAFIFGGMYESPDVSTQSVSGVMLGTGLGYINAKNGKVQVNKNKTPASSLWNTPYRNGIAEDYVCATAIINKACERGYSFDNVKDIAAKAKDGDRQLLDIFCETGAQLGELIELMRKKDGFEKLIVGGQVSRAWNLMSEGFGSKCNVPYHIVENPSVCALYGIKYCVAKRLENIYEEVK